MVLGGLLAGGCASLPSSGDPALFAPLGEPLPSASAEELARFERGRELFLRRFSLGDGLGPGVNAVSCAGCHEKPVPGGSASRYRNVFVRLVRGETLQVQPHFLDGARAPDVEVATTTRSPMPLFGAGLLAGVPAEEIIARADPLDADGDGISGRVAFERGFVGRFGGKAQIATLTGFVRLALADHLGLTSDPLPEESDGRGPLGLPTSDGDASPDPELAPADVADLVAFVSLLAAPEPDAPTPESELGRALFEECGCDGCHVPALDGPAGPVPAYTDLLLHDLGDELADGLQVATASELEHRTQPLWGIAPVGPYLHDGRADTLDDAIRWHGGEASAARDRYRALDAGDRGALLTFLESLGGSGAPTRGLVPLGAPLPPPGVAGGPGRLLGAAEAERFVRGRALFDLDVSLPAGLGPRFNGDACRSCHFDPVIGGAGPADVDVVRQALGPEAAIAHRYGTEDGRPAADSSAMLFERRQTPTTLGLGLIDAIPDEAILAGADPDDADGDGVSGRARVLPDGRLGRLGWKAAVPSLADFVRDALANEMGVTVAGVSGLGASTDDDAVSDPELGDTDVEDLLFFMRELGPPVAGGGDARGTALFASTGCATCHVPSLPGPSGAVPLYSDLLLHDVSAEGAAVIADGDAGRDFRTPPLWGLAATAPYLHDGRAVTIEDAVLAHDGEAARSRDAFLALAPADRAALLAQLEAL